MALNKFMHSRNIYKTPPDFEKMRKTFSEFSCIAKMDAKGKVTIDFKDPRSLRVLTKCLLKSDFNLDVEIPEDRLVPTLPLRLNYILWVEDLMAAIGRDTDVRGIDIGTGACAIYPLLAAGKNKWFMIGTEINAVSLQKAQENVKNNNLQEFIQIKRNEGAVLIENLFTKDVPEIFDFCMCNPPFYSNLQELCESRSPARLPPKNGFTGSVHELVTEGGELEFSRKLIKESKNCKQNVRIFTTMIGHKYNLSELLQDLKADKIKHTHTEFCQGRVTRWGLAWTYQNHDIYKLLPPREKLRKKNVPIIHKLPDLPNCANNLENAYNKLKLILSNLKINHRVLNKRGNVVALDIVAKVNTWSNQRRKKRQLQKSEENAIKKIKMDHKVDLAITSIENITSEMNSPQKPFELQTSGQREKQESITSETNSFQKLPGLVQTTEPGEQHASEINSPQKLPSIVQTSELRKKQQTNTTGINSLQKPSELVQTSEADGNQHIKANGNIFIEEYYQSSEEIEPLVQAFIKIFKKDDIISLETEFLTGTGGKESLHQVIQYIKNNWK